MTLDVQVRGLLDRALELYRDSARATVWLRRHRARLDEPVRLAVAGPRAAGKTTLVRAIGTDRAVMVDTPPLDAAEPDTVERTCMDADAVLYLVPRPAQVDPRLLRAMQDHAIARAAPVNALAVLSRADELGGGRVDALISARQVARRHRRATELGGLCQDVLPVAGLLADAGRTLREDEVGAFAVLARVPRAELDPHLLSADRFAGPAVPGGLPAEVRAGLIGRFGLFGVRLAVTLVRQGTGGAEALAAELVRRSGLAELVAGIDRWFVAPRPVLKARSALIALEIVLRNEPSPAAVSLAAELERVVAGAHEFRELRELARLRAGRAGLPDEPRAEALRLLGDEGTAGTDRLGGAGDPATVLDAVRRWRAWAQSPLLDAGGRRVAITVIRSCEAMLG
ncbi:hypothetical protein SAMN05421810_103124 [Amycolatopsis arida]|uniref:50S ribosome-binding GTPase n=1 Tax=Amycolatopsis arida TaxID=587909 RepID=A0A1I5SFH2_9PSEU|nr:hypothetical protein [Amycolatopsis arida]TDX96492.1 hypothetical protein CLV69_103634 [Amycolatopsis arida]SFP69442.1 hypothetical protein SAMN05421810_103124 [Amycolatopsis arida]